MSALLQIVSELRDVREAAEAEFRKAIRQASRGGHTGAEIARYAGLSKQRISQLLNSQEEGEEE